MPEAARTPCSRGIAAATVRMSGPAYRRRVSRPRSTSSTRSEHPLMASDQTELAARDRILRAASELFYEQGITSTGVDALIGLASVAKATFYRHFASKDDLVLAWLRSPYARWIEDVVPELERRVSSPLARLVRFWDVLGDWMEGHAFMGCPYINTLAEARETSDPAHEEIRSFVDEVEGYFTGTAAAAGIPEPADFGRRLRFIAMGFFISVLLERSREPAETARRATIDLLAAGLGATPKDIEERVASSAA
jgi:AcrR family transcriptional regulator